MTEHIIHNADQIVDGIVQLHQNIPGINYRSRCIGPRLPDEFDPNQYLSVLPHLSLVSGYVLDFFYYCDEDRMGCCPIVYVRREEDAPFELADEVFKHKDVNPILNYLITDGSPEGWFELAAFSELVGQFYLFWHSLYKRSRILTSQQDLENLIRDIALYDNSVLDAKDVDASVVVRMHESSIDVVYCLYSGRRGITQYLASFHRVAPHIRLCQDKELALIPYDDGIRF